MDICSHFNFISSSWHSWNLSFDAQEKKDTLVSPACLSACCMLFHFDIHSRNKHTLFAAIYSSLTVLSDENSRENENSETIYTSIQAPFNSSYEVSINPAYHVTSLMEEYYWGSGTQNGTVNAKRVVSFDFSKEQTLLSLET